MGYQSKSSRGSTSLPSYGDDDASNKDFYKEIVNAFEQQNTELRTLQGDVNSLRKMAGVAAPASGSQPGADYAGLGSFVKACVARKTGDTTIFTKAAADWEIVTDARGGYLVPGTVQSTIDATLRPYGSLLAACNFSQVEPGRTHLIPSYATAPTSAWQLTERGALDELDLEIQALERKPYAVGGYVDLSYQLFHQSAHDVGLSLTTEIVHGNRQAAETALVAGDEGVDSPYDGLLELAGTYSQAALATATSALLSKFVGESLADNPALWERGQIIVSPQVAETIMSEEGTSSNRGRFMIDDRGSTRFGRWPLIVTPAVGLNALMIDPSHVHVLSYGTTVLIDDQSGIKNLLVSMAVVNWLGFGVSLPTSISKAVISAIS